MKTFRRSLAFTLSMIPAAAAPSPIVTDLNGPSGGGRYGQETLAVSLGRSLPSPRWSAYGEAVYVITNLSGASDSSFLGGGIKYLVSNDVQLDLSFDRGLTADSPDWLLGLGLSMRF